jgi:hypothetical protein
MAAGQEALVEPWRTVAHGRRDGGNGFVRDTDAQMFAIVPNRVPQGFGGTVVGYIRPLWCAPELNRVKGRQHSGTFAPGARIAPGAQHAASAILTRRSSHVSSCI